MKRWNVMDESVMMNRWMDDGWKCDGWLVKSLPDKWINGWINDGWKDHDE